MRSTASSIGSPEGNLIHERWCIVNKGNAEARRLYLRHYSSEKRPALADPRQFIGPGETLVLITPAADAVFVWRKFIDDCPLGHGVNCAIFRNESRWLSSELILEAEEMALTKWPGERLYTYVNASKVRSTNPGYCFIRAGWRRCGITAGGLVVLGKNPATVQAQGGDA